VIVDFSTGWKPSDWKNRGACFLQQNCGNNYIYVNIPKNASSWMKEKFNRREYNYINDPIDATFIVVLRDPVSRWISGAAQAFVGCSPQSPYFFLNIGFNAIFDHVVIDEHTAPQTMFLDEINHDRTVWFNCDPNLIKNWKSWSSKKIVPVPNRLSVWKQFSNRLKLSATKNPYNISALGKANKFFEWPDGTQQTVTGWTQQQIIDTLTDHLNTCPMHLEQLKNFYKKDYELIQSIRFYDAR
jgi:hypothetical protein